MRLYLTFLLLVTLGYTQAQLNVELLSQVDIASDGNDVWGYVAPDGGEYAILGANRGVYVYDITDPRKPLEVDFIPQQRSIWRDIKTWGDYAYVVADQGGSSDGILIIDMSNLPQSISWENVNPEVDNEPLNHCHNIYIDEFGFAYLVGCNGNSGRINNGGAIMFDVHTTPGTANLVGESPPIYAHDVYVRDNKMYTSEIYAGEFSIYDVIDKDNVAYLASQSTPFSFTHNAWLSDDGNTIFTTDERSNAPVAAYDISDLDNIQYLDEFRPLETLGDGVIPHNVHVWQDWLIISYYTDGCIIVDAARPDNLIEVGNFDTFLNNSTGFDGVWGAFPFFPSGNIILGDIQNGLYVLGPNYKRACYLEGFVTDAATGLPIAGARLEIDFTEFLLSDNTNSAGQYKTGTVFNGSYTAVVSREGYKPVSKTVTLVNGEVSNVDFQLGKYVFEDITCESVDEGTIELSWPENPAILNYEISLDGMPFESITETQYTITGLEPFTTYSIVVTAIFQDCAPLSQVVDCMTLNYPDNDGDGVLSNDDCNDNDPNIFPGNTETCDDIDNNCDGAVDEGLATTVYYRDSDGDGYGDAALTLPKCRQPSGYVANDEDCDDNNAMINPSLVEVAYNGIDDDCNAATLDDDIDGDGFGVANDCDDTNAFINPDAMETPYNGLDDDCDPSTLDDDLDQDGAVLADDCDDNEPNIFPGNVETCDDIDNNCDGAVDEGLATMVYYRDSDGDGYGNAALTLPKCRQPLGYVANDEDCDDNNAMINPSLIELAYNGIDDDCNAATLDDDLDGDGFGVVNDCDDTNASINPDALETPYNGLDDDCDPSTLDDDLDQDGAVLADDCDDNDPNIFPGNVETCDDIDNNCDGAVDEGLVTTVYYRDSDGDGYGNAALMLPKCRQPVGYVDNDSDCDDTDAGINPDAMETPYNGIDDDCDGSTLDDDLDGDGFVLAEDCDDNDAGINPDALEIPNNEIDEDCDGSDLMTSVHDLDDGQISIYPNPAVEGIYIRQIGDMVYKVSLYNLKGQFVKGAIDQTFISLNDVSKGTYLLRIDNKTGSTAIVEKIVVLK